MLRVAALGAQMLTPTPATDPPPGHGEPLGNVPWGSLSPESRLQTSGRCLHVTHLAHEEQKLAAEKKWLQVPRLA